MLTVSKQTKNQLYLYDSHLCLEGEGEEIQGKEEEGEKFYSLRDFYLGAS